MRRQPFDLPLRLVVVEPIPGLSIALQRGQASKAAFVPPASQSPEAVIFDIDVRVDGRLPDGRPRLLGPAVQGPPQARFAYLAVGTHAGQPTSSWGGRVKFPLADLSWDKIKSLAPGERLMAQVAGRTAKGGPALASVPLLPPGWQVVAASNGGQ